MIEMRPMRWWHIEQAIEIERHLFGPTAWSAAQMWSELAREQRRYYVLLKQVDHGDDVEVNVVGYAGINIMSPDADVQTVAVAAQCQGQGWARRLVEALIHDAMSARCAQIMLEVSADNTRALALYERLGFEVIARRTSYYGPGNDALIMRMRPVRFEEATIT